MNARYISAVKPARIKDSSGDRIFFIFCYSVTVLLAVIVLLPLIYVVSCSFSSGIAVSTGKVLLWPVDFTLDGYKRVGMYPMVWRSYANTIMYTTGGTVLHICLVMIAAYPLARRGLPHKKIFMLFFSFTMLFNGGMIPSYLLIRDLGIMNTVWAMLIPGAFSAYNMVVARTFIQNSIPESLLEATQVDGCSDVRYFFQFVLPLSKAVIAVLSLQVAIAIWNSYFNALLYLTNDKLHPLQLVLRKVLLLSQISADDLMDPDDALALQGMADLMKYSLIVFATVPILCVYPFVQKYFVKGIMIGSIKG